MLESRVFSPDLDCTIRTIRSLQGKMIAALSASTALTLDCSRIEQADVSFVQMVLSAAKAAERQAKTLAVVNLPPVAEAAFRRAGVALPGATPS